MPELPMVDTAVEAVTVRTALERAATTLGGDGPARREARELAAALLGVSAAEVWLRRDAAVTAAAAARLAEAATLRRRGVPTAYVTGLRAFRTLELVSDPRALIPRPETEGLVDHVLAWAADRWGAESWGRVADIGTGTGCIALSLAVEGRFRRIIGVELSADAAALAHDNVARVAPATPVEIRLGDLVAPLAGERVDVVVSNPPYLTEAEYASLDRGVRDYEPREALESGTDGLEMTRRLLVGARGTLRPGGLLALEVDCRRARAVADRAAALGWRRVRVVRDLAGRARYVLAQWEES